MRRLKMSSALKNKISAVVFFIVPRSVKLGMIFKPVLFGYASYYTAGIAHRKAVFGNVSCNDASRTDNTALSYGYAGAHGDISGYPAIVLYGYGSAVFLFGGLARFGIGIGISVVKAKGMEGSKQGNARTHKNIISNGNGAYVKNGEIEIGIAVFAYFGICSEIKKYRALQIDPFGTVGEQGV